jgi:hypothetical protein
LNEHLTKFEVLKYALYGVAVFIIVSSYSWIAICGILVLSVTHEFGHALIAKLYGAFRGFAFLNGTPVTKVESNIMSVGSLRLCILFGALMNLLLAPFIMPLFSFSGRNLFYNIKYSAISLQYYVLLVLAVSSLDIYCVLRGKPLQMKVDKK